MSLICLLWYWTATHKLTRFLVANITLETSKKRSATRARQKTEPLSFLSARILMTEPFTKLIFGLLLKP